MPIKIRRDGALQTLTRIRVGQGGAVRDIRTVKVQQGGVLRTVASFISSLTASADTFFNAEGFASFGEAATVTSNSVTITPAGGVAPFSYAWTQTAGTSVSIASTTTATTYFTAGREIGFDTGTLQCVVTDALGGTATVSVYFQITVTQSG